MNVSDKVHVIFAVIKVGKRGRNVEIKAKANWLLVCWGDDSYTLAGMHTYEKEGVYQVIIGGSDITELDITAGCCLRLDMNICPTLKMLICNFRQLDRLNLTGCCGLEILVCSFCQLPDLELKSVLHLKQLLCRNNRLETLDVSECEELTVLDCSYNKLRQLNVSGCNKLKRLLYEQNPIDKISG